MPKGIHASTAAEHVERADKDDIGLWQILIGLPSIQNCHVDGRLIIAHPAQQFGGLGGACRLHLDIVNSARLVLDIDVEPDALAAIVDLDLLFGFGEREPADANAENPFEEFLAERGIAHDFLKDKIVAEIEFRPVFECFCHDAPPLSVLYHSCASIAIQNAAAYSGSRVLSFSIEFYLPIAACRTISRASSAAL